MSAPSPRARRALIRDDMRERVSAGQHCAACSAPCCTFRHNTMRITPLEAVELRDWLIGQNRWNETTRERLQACTERFDLANEVGDGRGQALRKSYTCPFFVPGPQGCTIDPDHKPYGCLAFNPRRSGVTEGGDCASDVTLLEQRDATWSEFETAQNAALQAAHNLPEKLPIPVMLLALPDDTP